MWEQQLQTLAEQSPPGRPNENAGNEETARNGQPVRPAGQQEEHHTVHDQGDRAVRSWKTTSHMNSHRYSA